MILHCFADNTSELLTVALPSADSSWVHCKWRMQKPPHMHRRRPVSVPCTTTFQTCGPTFSEIPSFSTGTVVACPRLPLSISCCSSLAHELFLLLLPTSCPHPVTHPLQHLPAPAPAFKNRHQVPPWINSHHLRNWDCSKLQRQAGGNYPVEMMTLKHQWKLPAQEVTINPAAAARP